MAIRPMEWNDGVLRMLDQRRLPLEECWLALETWQEVASAIRDMAVRGAPAIGVAAAYGMVLACLHGEDRARARNGLAASRPTAVNLFWALDRMDRVDPWTIEDALAEARRIEVEDLSCNEAIGRHGAALVPPGARILTVCNTGGLATAGHGTALGIIRTAFARDPGVFVYACETRPRQQGLRLTTWELLKEGIPFAAIADGAAASLMRAGKIDWVVAGADRIAANGDTANKIGTYALAVLAAHHGIPFVVAAPSSTLDPSLADGESIPIEERGAEELCEIEGVRVAPTGCPVFNPAFDVTPAALIEAIVTEQGVHRAPYRFTREAHQVAPR
ncbi:MAG: S-methyl-5-thioribose-1-phosphate isomerase [Fimbriimonadaceae bacterium]|nr:S-methyl-5-thioribose-1-phosphate isomerase [Chthonomonadaceae bacterium]MCO5295726.1 S-methyl-5-thioribose-1-phosphate isomerase [Fimbriimonadaceae bacterium]